VSDTERLVREALEYGGHREYCPRKIAALNECICGWSDARRRALASLAALTGADQ